VDGTVLLPVGSQLRQEQHSHHCQCLRSVKSTILLCEWMSVFSVYPVPIVEGRGQSIQRHHLNIYFRMCSGIFSSSTHRLHRLEKVNLLRIHSVMLVFRPTFVIRTLPRCPSPLLSGSPLPLPLPCVNKYCSVYTGSVYRVRTIN
jgi:hypothetical protein